MILSWEMVKSIFVIVFKYLPIYAYVRLFGLRESCWLVCERPTDARDNGYVFFKWMRERHPEQKIVYVIKKSAPDFNNVKGLGLCVEYGSIQHWYYYFAASVCCDTAWNICAPNDLAFLIMRDILPHRAKRVFLQHGITKDYMPQGRKHKLKADLFVCGAYPEWEYISRNFGYEESEVKYLGFARFDRLINTPGEKRQILFMPTWRTELYKTHDFENSNYCKTIRSLLSSADINRFLSSTGTELVYFLHPAIRDKKKYFVDFANDNVQVLNNEDFDMQRLICSASILITDFSSVYFDFAYQEKPVVYYHFDYDDYRKSHYEEGYFNYERDGFGPIVHNENQLLQSLIQFEKSNWIMSEGYRERVAKFFPRRDKYNCERHYQAIMELERR